MRSRVSDDHHKNNKKNNKKSQATGNPRPGGRCTRKRKGKGSIVKISNFVFVSLLVVLALVQEAEAVPPISVNGNVTAELAPPKGSVLSDDETGSPLIREVVSVAERRPKGRDGNVISNVVIESDSGLFGTTPVPVPASLSLLLSGLLAVAYRRRRRAGA
jgi:hypothetical protein